jgi:hypothetical protein
MGICFNAVRQIKMGERNAERQPGPGFCQEGLHQCEDQRNPWTVAHVLTAQKRK